MAAVAVPRINMIINFFLEFEVVCSSRRQRRMRSSLTSLRRVSSSCSCFLFSISCNICASMIFLASSTRRMTSASISSLRLSSSSATRLATSSSIRLLASSSIFLCSSSLCLLKSNFLNIFLTCSNLNFTLIAPSQPYVRPPKSSF